MHTRITMLSLRILRHLARIEKRTMIGQLEIILVQACKDIGLSLNDLPKV